MLLLIKYTDAVQSDLWKVVVAVQGATNLLATEGPEVLATALTTTIIA